MPTTAKAITAAFVLSSAKMPTTLSNVQVAVLSSNRIGHGRGSRTKTDADATATDSEGQQVTIDYYGEKYPITRLHGASYRGGVYFFFTSLAALVSVTAYLAITSVRQDKRPKRKSRRR